MHMEKKDKNFLYIIGSGLVLVLVLALILVNVNAVGNNERKSSLEDMEDKTVVEEDDLPCYNNQECLDLVNQTGDASICQYMDGSFWEDTDYIYRKCYTVAAIKSNSVDICNKIGYSFYETCVEEVAISQDFAEYRTCELMTTDWKQEYCMTQYEKHNN